MISTSKPAACSFCRTARGNQTETVFHLNAEPLKQRARFIDVAHTNKRIAAVAR